MPTNINDTIKDRIDSSFKKLYYQNNNGDFVPYVCVLCDRFLKSKESKTISVNQLIANRSFLSPDDPDSINPLIKEDYRLSGNHNLEQKKRLDGLMLSPRAPFLDRGFTSPGFCCCRSCLYGVERKQMPKYAIANGFFVGSPPKELTELTMLERSLLTPVQTWGYCFTYTGGVARNLEGNMTYFRTAQKQMVGNLSFRERSPSAISTAMMRMEAIGLNTDVVVLLHGRMTVKQKEAAKKHNTVRVSKLIAALEWLVQNNDEWKKKKINLDEIRQHIRTPTLIDDTQVVEGSEDQEQRNIEETETFRVFFPDGSMNQIEGGQKSMEDFKQKVQDLRFSGFVSSVQYNLHGNFVNDHERNNFVNACILQFPYGRGGLHEFRHKGNQSASEHFDREDYMNHVSRLSQKHFHEELFCLILYNMSVKQAMVKTASWRVRGGTTSTMIGRDLTKDHVLRAINDRRVGNRTRNSYPGSEFLSTVDTVTQNVPHSNEAALKARKTAEAIQVKFGQPSWFLTVTPDDDNSIILQIYSRTNIDLDNPDVSNLDEATASKRARERTKLRIEYPGISACFFADAVDIILKDIVGWDLENKKACITPGLFGIPNAFTGAIEEQGRGTLHIHLLIWIEEFNLHREDLFKTTRESNHAKETIIKQVDNLVTTKLHNDIFPEPCDTTETSTETQFKQVCLCGTPILMPSDTRIRLMRHKASFAEEVEKFAVCQTCGETFSDINILRNYIANTKGMAQVAGSRDLLGRLKSCMVGFQMPDQCVDESIVHAAYDKHIHTRACFLCNKPNKRKATYQIKNYECRFRAPKRAKSATEITPTTKRTLNWYHWDGSYSKRHIYEINLRRSILDIFQNESCTAITKSKLACNTNLMALMPGPVTSYVFKYNMKGTQEDDQEAYTRVLEATNKSLAKEVDPERTDYSVSLSRILSASVAHEKTNVIRGTLASYLTKTKSRFIFSHECVWCPLLDMRLFLENKRTYTTIKTNNKKLYRDSPALNYPCRPKDLSSLCLWDFLSHYTSVRLTSTLRKNPLEYFSYTNLDNCNHPSYINETGQFMQCVVPVNPPQIPKFSPYLIPDTASFGKCILDTNSVFQGEQLRAVEEYCMYVLMLFVPFRSKQDLQIEGSYHKKFLSAYKDNMIDERATRILQNIQDYRGNASRHQADLDDLQRSTKPYNPQTSTHGSEANEVDKEEEAQRELYSEAKRAIIEAIQNTTDDTSTGNIPSANIPEEMMLQYQKNQGKFRCGQQCVANMTRTRTPNFFSTFTDNQTQQTFPPAQEQAYDTNRVFSQSTFVKILLQRTARRPIQQTNRNPDMVNTRQHSASLLKEANGSIESIFDWAIKKKLDKPQRRAFEVFCATYILSFYFECTDDTDDSTDIEIFNTQKTSLEQLQGWNTGRKQLIAFLHGPGGSGKSTVIDLFLSYAQQFSSYIDGFVFTRHTIRITAMSGVAATIIKGETTHSALYLNNTNPINNEQIDNWSETRMVIIDEISFASASQLQLISQRLKYLKQKRHLLFGGIHVIFAGDLCQLEPVASAGEVLHKEERAEFDLAINCYIELNGSHRFKGDPAWGNLLRRFRLGEVSDSDLNKINARVVKPSDPIPNNIRYATYCNRDRDAINAALFEKYCHNNKNQAGIATDALAIYCDQIDIYTPDKTFIPLRNTCKFWQTCGESHIQKSNRTGKIDPVLRIYPGCLVMFPYNKDVPNGIANGTQALVHQIHFVSNVPERYVKLSNNTKIRAVYASEVHHVDLKHVQRDITPQIFSIGPEKFTLGVNMLKPTTLQTKESDREGIKIRCNQVPFLINNATTGHKLQGLGLDQLFVHEWRYVTNWPYVILSRVRTIAGLYLRLPLSKDKKRYAMPETLKAMLHRLETKAIQYFSDQQYSSLLRSSQQQTNQNISQQLPSNNAY